MDQETTRRLGVGLKGQRNVLGFWAEERLSGDAVGSAQTAVCARESGFQGHLSKEQGLPECF